MTALPDLLPLYAPPDGRHVRAGMAMSADGGIAFRGRSAVLSTPADRAVFSVLRAHADVVLVGAGTARLEGYGPVSLPDTLQAWRLDHGRDPNPPLALVSRSMDLPARALPGALAVTCGRESGPDVVSAGKDAVDLAGALDQLAERGLTRVLCEGGPGLLADLVLAGRLDQICCTVSPRLLGGGDTAIRGLLGRELAEPVELSLDSLIEHDGSLLLRWNIKPGRGEDH